MNHWLPAHRHGYRGPPNHFPYIKGWFTHNPVDIGWYPKGLGYRLALFSHEPLRNGRRVPWPENWKGLRWRTWAKKKNGVAVTFFHLVWDPNRWCMNSRVFPLWFFRTIKKGEFRTVGFWKTSRLTKMGRAMTIKVAMADAIGCLAWKKWEVQFFGPTSAHKVGPL